MTNLHPIVTLITDFGLQDEYVGVLKGVIYTLAPAARIVDISHRIPPQSIRTAKHLLTRSYRFFPAATVHLVIVDPGVGSERAILAISADSYYFVGPDNGVFTAIFDHAANLDVFRVNPSRLLKTEIMSTTFHGRDIMAPVAARLAVGMEISSLGQRIAPDQCHRLEEVACRKISNTLLGEIIHIDTFGNLCTNIRRQDVEEFTSGYEVSIVTAGNLTVPLVKRYCTQSAGTVLALFDSHDYLEIAINQGNAAQQLHLSLGGKIVLSRTPKVILHNHFT
jgi:S-adenosyl-L-methionine hydrolase (adenosine-forming)